VQHDLVEEFVEVFPDETGPCQALHGGRFEMHDARELRAELFRHLRWDNHIPMEVTTIVPILSCGNGQRVGLKTVHSCELRFLGAIYVR
jgi:hypothetical protein